MYSHRLPHNKTPLWMPPSRDACLVGIRAGHEEVRDGRPLVRPVLVQPRPLAVKRFGHLHNVGPCAVQPTGGREQLQHLRRALQTRVGCTGRAGARKEFKRDKHFFGGTSYYDGDNAFTSMPLSIGLYALREEKVIFSTHELHPGCHGDMKSGRYYKGVRYRARAEEPDAARMEQLLYHPAMTARQEHCL